jgi:hypothetical protein
MFLSASDATPIEEPGVASKVKPPAARCWTEGEKFPARGRSLSGPVAGELYYFPRVACTHAKYQ